MIRGGHASICTTAAESSAAVASVAGDLCAVLDLCCPALFPSCRLRKILDLKRD